MARGRFHPHADADVYCVLSASDLDPADRAKALYPAFLGTGVPVDLTVYTRDEVRALLDRGHPFITRIRAEARRLA